MEILVMCISTFGLRWPYDEKHGEEMAPDHFWSTYSLSGGFFLSVVEQTNKS